MDAFLYLKELNRLCNSYDCPDCPLNSCFCDSCELDLDASDKEIKDRILFVENWAKEHPQKTMLNDFLEKYPNIKLENGVPNWICPNDLGYCKDDSFCSNHSCSQCWNRPLEE